MGQVGDLIGAEGAAAAGVLGPTEHPGLEEGAIDDQLPAALEQVEQTNLTLGPVELVLLLHRHPRHPSTLSGQRITGAGQGLLLHEELLARSLPLLLRHDRGCLHRDMPFRVLLVSLLACSHPMSPLSEFADAHRQDSSVDPAPATITAVLAMHAGHICRPSERLFEFPMCWMPPDRRVGR